MCIRDRLESNNARTDFLANRLITAETNLQNVADRANGNHLAIEYLALV